MVTAVEFHLAPYYVRISPQGVDLSGKPPTDEPENSNPAGSRYWRPNPKNGRNADQVWFNEKGEVDPLWGNP